MRRLICLFITLCIIFSLTEPAFAISPEMFPSCDSPKYNEYTPSVIETDSESVSPYDYYGERHVYRGTVPYYKTVHVIPTGQPSNGYEGGSGGFVCFFETGGSNINVTVEIEKGPYTFTVETGRSTGIGQGYGDKVPSESGRYQFVFIKHYTITVKIYDVYQGPDYKYTYRNITEDYSLTHDWIRLGD